MQNSVNRKGGFGLDPAGVLVYLETEFSSLSRE
jgi:hypothetical protein